MDDDTLYPCVGICTPDPISGHCQGCGRPYLADPAPVTPTPLPDESGDEQQPSDPDTEKTKPRP